MPIPWFTIKNVAAGEIVIDSTTGFISGNLNFTSNRYDYDITAETNLSKNIPLY